MVRLRREKSEIVMDILKTALRGAKKTHIQQRANLNREMLKRYLAHLLSRRLIVRLENPDGEILYRTTDEGRTLLKAGGAFYALLLKGSPEPA